MKLLNDWFYITVKHYHADTHNFCHLLIEKYWILNGRRIMTCILSKCTSCKRFNYKKLEFSFVSLPRSWVIHAAEFQIITICMTGLLCLKRNQNVGYLINMCYLQSCAFWMCYFSSYRDFFNGFRKICIAQRKMLYYILR